MVLNIVVVLIQRKDDYFFSKNQNMIQFLRLYRLKFAFYYKIDYICSEL